MSAGRFYITTPIYYVNDVPHLGHAFEVIGIDVQARYRRLVGHDVFFLTGTDEHGQKNAAVAARKGVTPQEHVDAIAPEFRRVWDLLGVSYDDFIRTTEPRHHAAAQWLWRKVAATGDIYLGKYEGWYDVKEESFITETEMKAKGLEPDGVRIKRMAEDAYFFRLGKYRDRLREFIAGNPEFVQPEFRRNEVLSSFLGENVPDLCVSRTSISWGIPVPDAPGHVMYVWFDALTNYATAVGLGDPSKSDLWNKWWPAGVHVVGKDIVKFHCVIWPAMLMAAGIELPRSVFGHGFINVLRRGQTHVEGEKMSKFGGHVISPLDYVARVGVEPLRYFLMREANYGGDAIINEEALEVRYNADLADTLGNLVSRTTSMVERYLPGGVVRRTTPAERTDVENAMLSAWQEAVATFESSMPRFEYSTSLAKTWEFLSVMNKSITTVEPWALAKKPEQAERLRVFLSALIEGIAGASYLVEPFMPSTAVRIREAVGISGATPWAGARQWGGLLETATVRKAAPMFPKLEADKPGAKS